MEPDESPAEYEVDTVLHRTWKRGKYHYCVAYKGWDEDIGDKPMDHEWFAGCQKLLAEFDKTHPRGSLPRDSPADQRKYKEATDGVKRRRSARNRHVLALNEPRLYDAVVKLGRFYYSDFDALPMDVGVKRCKR
eukprot:SAG22_NODE_6050_length_909_cov_1.970370_2_plen_134_part_00